MYFLVWLLTKNRPASFIAGLTYLFYPHRLTGILTYSQLGFLIAYSFAPLAIFFLEKAIQSIKWKKYALLCAFSISIIVYSAIEAMYFIILFIFVPYILYKLLMSFKNRNNFKRIFFKTVFIALISFSLS